MSGYDDSWVSELDVDEIMEELSRYMIVPKKATNEQIKDAIFAAALSKLLHAAIYGPDQLRRELK